MLLNLIVRLTGAAYTANVIFVLAWACKQPAAQDNETFKWAICFALGGSLFKGFNMMRGRL